MFRIQIKGFFVVAMISMMVVIGCSSISKNSNTPTTTEASPSVSQVKDNMTGMNHGTKFNINTSLEPELDEIAASLKIDALYDKVKKQRPYNNLNELVSKQVLTQAQFDQVKDMLTLEGTLTGEAKDADYMVKLGLMKGHLLVAKELLDMKRPAEALPHIG
nr:helix-hairpin-helix domain-containing protein [Nostocaceae cyanobacterium]